MERLIFSDENRKRIRDVELSFGSRGKPLYEQGRVLIGEGTLMKQSRRGPQSKVFFLFNDLLVYGSIIMNGRWYNRQKIIPLEAIQVEDLEDGLSMRNQMLIRTPRKSFYVSAASHEEKQAWIDHLLDCQASLLQTGSRTLRSTFAATWIPDEVSSTCMRCSFRFTVAHRRHHCRNCGFLVCGTCSKNRAVIEHIHPTKQVRICRRCVPLLLDPEAVDSDGLRPRGDSGGRFCSDEDEMEGSSEEEEEVGAVETRPSSSWGKSWSAYILNPEDFSPLRHQDHFDQL